MIALLSILSWFVVSAGGEMNNFVTVLFVWANTSLVLMFFPVKAVFSEIVANKIDTGKGHMVLGVVGFMVPFVLSLFSIGWAAIISLFLVAWIVLNLIDIVLPPVDATCVVEDYWEECKSTGRGGFLYTLFVKTNKKTYKPNLIKSMAEKITQIKKGSTIKISTTRLFDRIIDVEVPNNAIRKHHYQIRTINKAMFGDFLQWTGRERLS
ncbi:MAG: hypothetical protein COU65_04365 [Candidatus Pacebacteria bacterium CG10_big_fil_rev_8_21_14_0_10_42_12]|nr:MAG: hypothetical protein COU65_04365 [Candidatus Pacebacteria bacterium CG10_big_fil_rev_8_21_14_0_10_42_12]